MIKKLASEAKDPQAALPVRIMPRNVSMRWNSTYDMLKFAYIYREAINRLTDNRALNLSHCGISDNEWALVGQLRDVLKVSSLSCVQVFNIFDH